MDSLRSRWILLLPVSIPLVYAALVSWLAPLDAFTPLDQLRFGLAGLPMVAIAFGWAVRCSVRESRDASNVLEGVRELFATLSPFRLKLVVAESVKRINAVSVGGIWTGATIVLSRGLLNQLPAAAQRMLLLHEVAHQVRHHAWLRQLTLLGLIIPFLQSWHQLAQGSLWVWSLWQCVLLLWSFVAMVVVNRSLEKDADLTALRLARQLQWPRRLAAAALGAAIIQASYGSHDRPNWSHPSVVQRTRLLRVVGDSESPEALERQPMTNVALVLLAVGFLAIVSVWSN